MASSVLRQLVAVSMNAFIVAACGAQDEVSQADAPHGSGADGESTIQAPAAPQVSPEPAVTAPAAPQVSPEPDALPVEAPSLGWNECGRIEGTDPGGVPSFLVEVRDLAITADGSLLLVNGDGTTAWEVASEFSQSIIRWTWSGTPENGNVAVSPDGRYATISGDIRGLLDGRTGEVIPLPAEAPDISALEEVCLNVEFEFSPDGRWVAGKQWARHVDVFDTQTRELVAELATPSCGQGISFSPDGSRLATPEMIFSTETWGRVGDAHRLPDGWDPYTPDRIEYSADGSTLLRTSCRGEVCRSTLGDASLPALDSPIQQRHLSKDGQWVIAGDRVLHWSSGALHMLPDAISASIFAPDGDVIAGLQDGGLVRYCRSE